MKQILTLVLAIAINLFLLTGIPSHAQMPLEPRGNPEIVFDGEAFRIKYATPSVDISHSPDEPWPYDLKIHDPESRRYFYVASPAVVVGISTRTVRIMAKSGRICAAMGHSWRSGRPGEGETHPGSGVFFSYADYHPHTSYRTCKVCGHCQSQSLEWK